MTFREDQILRYSRQILLKEIGGEGQEKLLKSKVLLVGIGGLGSPAALYLAAAGVGIMGLIDGDRVDITNLQRQVLHFTGDVGVLKTESAKEKLEKLNPDVDIRTYNTALTADNAIDIIKEYNFIIDGTDTFASKYLINDACVIARKPFSHAGILRFEGISMTHIPGSACYRCLYEEPPPPGSVPSCSQAGVIGPVAGMFGMVQATEAIKYIAGFGELLVNKLLIADLASMFFSVVQLERNADCPVCGRKPEITALLKANYEKSVCTVK